MPCLVPIIGVVLCIRLGCGDVNMEGKLKKESEREEGGKCQSVVRDRHIRRDRGRKKKDIRNATCWLSG